VTPVMYWGGGYTPNGFSPWERVRWGFGAGSGKGGSGKGGSVGGVGKGGLLVVAVLLRVDIAACSREGDQDEDYCLHSRFKLDGGMLLAAGWFIAVPSLRYRPCSEFAVLAIPSLQ
jgi:hypothetical protein